MSLHHKDSREPELITKKQVARNVLVGHLVYHSGHLTSTSGSTRVVLTGKWWKMPRHVIWTKTKTKSSSSSSSSVLFICDRYTGYKIRGYKFSIIYNLVLLGLNSDPTTV